MEEPESHDEWLEDFASSPLTQGEMDELLLRARRENDPQLRRLVRSFKGLQWVTGALLQRLELVEPASAQEDPLKTMARAVIHLQQ